MAIWKAMPGTSFIKVTDIKIDTTIKFNFILKAAGRLGLPWSSTGQEDTYVDVCRQRAWKDVSNY